MDMIIGALACARSWVIGALWVCGVMQAHAGTATVAVASSFAPTFQQLAPVFEADTGHALRVIAGSPGKFYAQIRVGAPFHVLLAADVETPRKLEGEGLTVLGQRFTYARGKLVLWSTRPDLVDDKGEVLRKGVFNRLAMANPKVAPYGAAALQVLTRLGVQGPLSGRIVQGESVGQAFQFVASGNADLGFVALSQLLSADRSSKGSWGVVPPALYTPLVQDAVLLKQGQSNEAALALMGFLKGDKARALMRVHGHEF